MVLFLYCFFFFSSRRRHTRCALVTGVQTCALPILEATAVVARLSRLIVDFNRAEDAPGLIPHISDGIAIPGNAALCAQRREDRLIRYHRAYHGALAGLVAETARALIGPVTSLTPRPETPPEEQRTWQGGGHYNTERK